MTGCLESSQAHIQVYMEVAATRRLYRLTSLTYKTAVTPTV